MKRIDLFSIASAIGLISTAAFAQIFPNFDVRKAMEIAGQKVFADLVLSATHRKWARVPSVRASEALSDDPPHP